MKYYRLYSNVLVHYLSFGHGLSCKHEENSFFMRISFSMVVKLTYAMYKKIF